ncbi:MAG: NlpC/P60 family protein [Actinomycetaceae bacterium]|nr:NlpC/P60 family protein [Actinomycetaceae bacterium]
MSKFFNARVIATITVSASLVIATPGLALADEAEDARDRMSVAQIEVELAKVSAESAQAQIEVQQVAEELAAAQGELAKAKEEQAAAEQAVANSWNKYQEERETLALLSQTTYRTGSGNAQRIAPYLTQDGLTDVERRGKIVRTVTGITDTKLQRVAAMHQVAKALEDQAAETEKRVEEAQAEVEARAEQVKALAEGRQARVEEVQTERANLIAQLAERRGTTVAQEEARQLEIERQQVARQEAADRARVEREQNLVAQAETNRQAENAANNSAQEQAEKQRQEELAAAAAEKARQEAEAERKSREEAEAAAKRAEEEARRQAEAEEAARKAAEEEEARRQAEAEANAAANASSRGAAVVAFAQARIGTPYLWGGTGVGGYDCSGLALMAWASQGVTLPRTSQQQYWATQRVSISNLQPGDLVFYGPGGSSSGIYHVAIYAGNGMMVEATVPGDYVRLNPLRYGDLVPYGGRP